MNRPSRATRFTVRDHKTRLSVFWRGEDLVIYTRRQPHGRGGLTIAVPPAQRRALMAAMRPA